MPPDSSNTSVKKFVVYDIIIRQDSAASDQNSAVIERRYTHFLHLYTNLRRSHPQLMQKFDFPKKAFMGNFSAELISERSGAFEYFLDYVAAMTDLRESPHFLTFLQEIELDQACQLLDERRNEQAVPILENCFRLLNKVSLISAHLRYAIADDRPFHFRFTPTDQNVFCWFCVVWLPRPQHLQFRILLLKNMPR